MMDSGFSEKGEGLVYFRNYAFYDSPEERQEAALYLALWKI